MSMVNKTLHVPETFSHREGDATANAYRESLS